MMFRQLPVISMGAVAVVCFIVTTIISVDCFTVPSTSSNFRSHVAVASPYTHRSLIIVGATRNWNDEFDTKISANVSPIRLTAIRIVTAGIAAMVLLLSSPDAVWADGQTKDFKFPPIDYSDANRCILKGGSSMGQANAARDKLYDLRQCKLAGVDATGYDLSGVIMKGTDLSKANLKEAQFSKGYLQASNFDGADFSNAIVDRANFAGSSLRGTLFNNAVLTGTSFDDADLENADFTEAAIGIFDVRNLCKNPTLKGENPTTGADTRLSVGCQ